MENRGYDTEGQYEQIQHDHIAYVAAGHQDHTYETPRLDKPSVSKPVEYQPEHAYDVLKTPSAPAEPSPRRNFCKIVAIVAIVALLLSLGVVGYLAWRVVASDQSADTGTAVGKQTGDDVNSTTAVSTTWPSTTTTTPTTTTQNPAEMRDCADVWDTGRRKSAVYEIRLGAKSVPVYCDMETDGGGWTVLLKRRDGSVTFDTRLWAGYKEGFGDPAGEYYIGNDNLHAITMTNNKTYKLRVDLTSETGLEGHAVYSLISVDSEQNKYRLTLGQYSGNITDGLALNRNQAFSTSDQDNDSHSVHCAQVNTGGWWYGDCTYAKLLSGYGSGGTQYNRIGWNGFKNTYIKYADMKIKPV